MAIPRHTHLLFASVLSCVIQNTEIARNYGKQGKRILYMKWAVSFAILGIYVRILILKRPLLFNFTRGKFLDARESMTDL